MSRTPAGYPTVFGNKRFGVSQHVGPASYTQVGVATPPTGGDTLTAIELGLKQIEVIGPSSISQDGQYYAIPIKTNTQVNPSSCGQASVRLMWIDANTGAEVAGAVDLSGKTVLVSAVGF